MLHHDKKIIQSFPFVSLYNRAGLMVSFFTQHVRIQPAKLETWFFSTATALIQLCLLKADVFDTLRV